MTLSSQDKHLFFTLFILSRASDNTTSPNIGGTDAWAVPPPEILRDRPPKVSTPACNRSTLQCQLHRQNFRFNSDISAVLHIFRRCSLLSVYVCVSRLSVWAHNYVLSFMLSILEGPKEDRPKERAVYRRPRGSGGEERRQRDREGRDDLVGEGDCIYKEGLTASRLQSDTALAR